MEKKVPRYSNRNTCVLKKTTRQERNSHKKYLKSMTRLECEESKVKE